MRKQLHAEMDARLKLLLENAQMMVLGIFLFLLVP